jgi:predicted nucleotidyltransferase
MNLIELKIQDIRRLCASHKVSRLFAFGSVLNDSFNDDSDIDLIVDFDDIELKDYADNYFDLKEELEQIFNRPVDLLEEKAIRNPYFRDEIDKERKLIYG